MRYEVVEVDGRWYVRHDGEQVGPDDGFGSSDEAFAWVSARAREHLQQADDDDGGPVGIADFEIPVLIPEGQETSDERTILEGATEWREPPLPLMLQTQTEVGHFGARLAGTILQVGRTGSDVTATGFLHESEAGRELLAILDAQERFGVSADVGDMDADWECLEYDEEGWCERGLLTVERAELMGATATPFPAFADAHIVLGDRRDDEPEPEPAAVTASVPGEVDLPVADRDAAWDAAEATSRIFAACTEDDEVDVACVSRGFLWRDDDEDGTAQAHYSLPYCDVVDGTLTIVPDGVVAAVSVLAGGRGGVEGLSDDEVDAAQTRACALYDRINDQLGLEGDDALVCPFDDDDASADGGDDGQAAANAPAVLVASAFDESWFADPGLDGPTPLTIEDDGRVFGHAAEWGTCHIGYNGVCITPPRSEASYAYFATGEVRCGDCSGRPIPTGVVTMDTGHAPDDADARAASAHYDDTGTAVADVAVGEDEYGIWVAGAVRDSVLDDPERLRALRASSLSGDWRRLGGRLELVALLAVNVPGFPVRRVAASGRQSVDLSPRAHVEQGRQVSLVASGIVRPGPRQAAAAAAEPDGYATLRRLAASGLRDRVAPARADVADRLRDRVRR